MCVNIRSISKRVSEHARRVTFTGRVRACKSCYKTWLHTVCPCARTCVYVRHTCVPAISSIKIHFVSVPLSRDVDDVVVVAVYTSSCPYAKRLHCCIRVAHYSSTHDLRIASHTLRPPNKYYSAHATRHSEFACPAPILLCGIELGVKRAALNVNIAKNEIELTFIKPFQYMYDPGRRQLARLMTSKQLVQL